MEPTKFDELTKALATSTSRRQALKTIAATTLGGILGLGGIGTVFARCKGVYSKCNHDNQCCSGVCCNGTCCNGICQNGQCVCVPSGGTCNIDHPEACCSRNCSCLAASCPIGQCA